MSDNGKWMCSSNEEHWNDGERFNTKTEAIAYAIGVFADSYGLDDGDRYWVGQIKCIDVNDMVARGLRSLADHVVEQFGEYLYENVGEFASDEIGATKEQCDDLDNILDTAITGWIVKHKIVPTTLFSIEDVTSYTFERCEHLLHTGAFEPQRCVKHNMHEGDCAPP